MEDHDKSKATKSESIIELTPDMEMTDASQIDIIDLTDMVDGPDEIPSSVSPVEESQTETQQPISRPSSRVTVSNVIEQEVEAAFDFVQSPIRETTPEEEPLPDPEGLMDKLSDIPRMVDDALEASAEPDDEYTADAGGPDEADDEVIELTDIVDASELAAAGLGPDEDDDIIELNEIVDSSDLEAAGLKLDEVDEVIELTDIVDPAELHVGAVAAEADETAGAQAAASEAPADASLEDQEYEDLLEVIDTLDTEDLLVDLAEEEAGLGTAPASVEPDAGETETLAEDADGDVQDEDREYVEMLETIDKLDPQDLLVSVDEAGLLDARQNDAGAADDEDGLVTLTDVLNRDVPEKSEEPPVERVGGVIQEVEEATGRDVKTLTDQEVEAAVERILRTKYAETIERLIANAVEKAVNREIENLKRTMLDDE